MPTSRRPPKSLLFAQFLALSLSALCGIAAQSPGNQADSGIQVEREPKSIPAGRGQPPFDVTRHSIPLREIQSGGPPKDGIPALDHPAFISVPEADRFLRSQDAVLGLEYDGEAKAYPIRILNWHEVVNDQVGRQHVLVSW